MVNDCALVGLPRLCAPPDPPGAAAGPGRNKWLLLGVGRCPPPPPSQGSSTGAVCQVAAKPRGCVCVGGPGSSRTRVLHRLGGGRLGDPSAGGGSDVFGCYWKVTGKQGEEPGAACPGWGQKKVADFAPPTEWLLMELLQGWRCRGLLCPGHCPRLLRSSSLPAPVDLHAGGVRLVLAGRETPHLNDPCELRRIPHKSRFLDFCSHRSRLRRGCFGAVPWGPHAGIPLEDAGAWGGLAGAAGGVSGEGGSAEVFSGRSRCLVPAG